MHITPRARSMSTPHAESISCRFSTINKTTVQVYATQVLCTQHRWKNDDRHNPNTNKKAHNNKCTPNRS